MTVLQITVQYFVRINHVIIGNSFLIQAFTIPTGFYITHCHVFQFCATGTVYVQALSFSLSQTFSDFSLFLKDVSFNQLRNVKNVINISTGFNIEYFSTLKSVHEINRRAYLLKVFIDR